MARKLLYWWPSPIRNTPMLCILLPLLFASPQAQAFEFLRTSAGTEIRWNVDDINVNLNPSNDMGLDEAEVEDALLNAMQVWEDVGAGLAFVYTGVTDSALTSFDGQHIVYFTDDWQWGSDCPANTTPYYDDDTGQLYHFDIAINTRDYVWSVDGAEGTWDLENALTHELGHALGLWHSEDEDATMWPQAEPGELKKRTLELDDRDGLRLLYLYDRGEISCSSSPASPAGLGLGALLLGSGLVLRRRRH